MGHVAGHLFGFACFHPSRCFFAGHCRTHRYQVQLSRVPCDPHYFLSKFSKHVSVSLEMGSKTSDKNAPKENLTQILANSKDKFNLDAQMTQIG